MPVCVSLRVCDWSYSMITGLECDKELFYPAVSLVYGLAEVTIHSDESSDPQCQHCQDQSVPDNTCTSDCGNSLKDGRLDGEPIAVANSLKDGHLDIEPIAVANSLKDGRLDIEPIAAEVSLEDGRLDIEPIAAATPMELAETVTEEDIEYTEVAQLPIESQHLVQLGHGWDVVKRGGLVQVYPSLPYICLPSLNFAGSVQVRPSLS